LDLRILEAFSSLDDLVIQYDVLTGEHQALPLEQLPAMVCWPAVVYMAC